MQAYKTGRGRIYVRAQAEVLVDEKANRETILITELPYMLNKARLIEKIAELVRKSASRASASSGMNRTRTVFAW